MQIMVAENKKCRDINKFNFKAVYKCNLEGNILETFECLSDAARNVNGDSSFIARAAKNKQKTAYGYKWKFVENHN